MFNVIGLVQLTCALVRMRAKFISANRRRIFLFSLIIGQSEKLQVSFKMHTYI